MPFTVSHAAAVYPLRRTRLHVPALVIGSFSPDLVYFLLFTPHNTYGHTLPGLFLVSLPLGLLTFWVYYGLVERPLMLLLPAGLAARMRPEPRHRELLQPRSLARIVLSMLAGAVTHIVWDSFTHTRGWIYPRLPVLHGQIHLPFVGKVLCINFLQDVSSVVGLLLVAVWFREWYRSRKPTALAAPRPALARLVNAMRIGALPLAMACAVVPANLGAVALAVNRRHEMWPVLWVVSTMSLVMVQVVLWSLIVQGRFPSDLPAAPQPR